MRKLFIPAAITLAIAISGAAMAQSTLSFAGLGFYTLNGSDLAVSNMSVAGFETTGDLNLAAFTEGSLDATLNGATIDQGFVGTANFDDLPSADGMDVSLVTTSGTFNGSTYGVSGNWTYTSGTGTYANLTGSGTFAGTFNPSINQYSITTFAGTLMQAVPTPATYGFLGIGAIALIARKRRS